MCKNCAERHARGANAFRTSHYPYAEEMYALCDREGIVIIDETPAVGIGAGAAHDPYREWGSELGEYHAQVLEAMIRRDKNHPCVIGWSLGNEAGWGPNFVDCAAWIHDRDPSRFVHYHPAYDEPEVDVISLMYPQVDVLAAHAASDAGGRAVIMCENAHAMGSVPGAVMKYWGVVER